MYYYSYYAYLFYAHLYLGLYFEALGEDKKSASHIKMAATDYRMDHYMGRVAQVHHSLRSKQATKAVKPATR